MKNLEILKAGDAGEKKFLECRPEPPDPVFYDSESLPEPPDLLFYSSESLQALGIEHGSFDQRSVHTPEPPNEKR